jgi:hypothetical protein
VGRGGLQCCAIALNSAHACQRKCLAGICATSKEQTHTRPLPKGPPQLPRVTEGGCDDWHRCVPLGPQTAGRGSGPLSRLSDGACMLFYSSALLTGHERWLTAAWLK